jgi:hypothetical protein
MEDYRNHELAQPVLHCPRAIFTVFCYETG